MGFSFHGSTGPARSLLQCGLPTGSQLPSGIHLLRCGVLPRLQVDICSTEDLHGLQWDSLPHHGLPHRLQGDLCFGAWRSSSPACFTDLGVCRVVFSHVFSPLSSDFSCIGVFLSFLNMLSQRHYNSCRLAQLWSVVGPSWSQLALALSDMGEAPSSFSQKPPLPATNTLPRNLNRNADISAGSCTYLCLPVLFFTMSSVTG